MSNSEPTAGQICDPCIQKYVEWKIENYLSFPQRADTFIESPIFHFLNASWCLMLCPNGERKFKSVEHLSIFLSRKDPGSEGISINFTIGIKIGKNWHKGSGSHCFETYSVHGWPKFVARNEIFRKKSEILPDGTLTVSCLTNHFKSVVHSSSQTKPLDGIINLSRDFHSLFLSKQTSDVTIQVKSRLFRVHKLVLGTRSSVFSAMFKHNMKENSSGTVKISDCEPDAFHDFLTYIYAGTIEKLNSENVTELCFLADKYDLSDLKALSLDFMKNNLNLDTVCSVMTMADQHNEKELKESAAELIRKNLKTIIPTQQWISFMATNPSLAAEILMTVIPD